MDTLDITEGLFTFSDTSQTVLFILLALAIVGFFGMFIPRGVGGVFNTMATMFVIGSIGSVFSFLIAPGVLTPSGEKAVAQVIEYADSTCGLELSEDEAELWLNSVFYDAKEAEDLKTGEGIVAVDSVTETDDSETVKMKCATFEDAPQ